MFSGRNPGRDQSTCKALSCCFVVLFPPVEAVELYREGAGFYRYDRLACWLDLAPRDTAYSACSRGDGVLCVGPDGLSDSMISKSNTLVRIRLRPD